jgi:hypothetical protein
VFPILLNILATTTASSSDLGASLNRLVIMTSTKLDIANFVNFHLNRI